MTFFGIFVVKAMIDQEVKNGIPSHRIILGGFSQARIAYMLIIEGQSILFCIKNVLFLDPAKDNTSVSVHTY